MQESILRKLEALVERHQEVEQLLSQPDVIADQEKFRELNREYSQLQITVTSFKDYTRASDDPAEMEQMLKSDDPDMVEMAQEEIEPTRVMTATASLKFVLVPVVMKQPFLQASFSECIPIMLILKAGPWKLYPRLKAKWGAIRKSLPNYQVKALMAI